MSIDDVKRWLKLARKRLWQARHKLEEMPKDHPDYKDMVGTVTHRMEVKEALLKKLKRKLRRKDKDIIKSTALGSPHWGGCRDVMEAKVIPVLQRHNVPITSQKRTETYGNPGSDHHVSQTNADACDGGIGEAHWLADEIGEAFGILDVRDYVAYYVTIEGVRMRLQCIAATHGTGPHIHNGLRRS